VRRISMRKRWMIQISFLVLLVATVFSTGVTFADTGNTFAGTFQERVQERLDAAVADGKITAEEAAEKLSKLQGKLNTIREKIQTRLNAAVAEGAITEEAAAERLNRFEERGPKRLGFIGRDALEERLDAAVADGKITAEEAAEKLAKFEERINEQRTTLEERLNAAVVDGKITVEEADEKLAKFEEMIVSGGKFQHHNRGKQSGFMGRDALEERLNAAVVDGKITAEEADEKLAKFEERINEQRTTLEERLNAAVVDGKITVEEADEKLAKFEEMIVSGGKFKGPKFENGGGKFKGPRFWNGGNGQNSNANSAVYQGV
jgi:uncharacterized coiled-coil protein SlyX